MLRYEILCYFTLTLLSIFLRASKSLSYIEAYSICNVFMKMYLQLLFTTLESTDIIHSSNGYSFAIGRFVISPPAVRSSTARTSPSFPVMSP